MPKHAFPGAAEGIPKITRPLPNIRRALDMLDRAWSEIELVSMAAEAGVIECDATNAIAYGCINAQERLRQVKDCLDPGAPADAGTEGGAA